jgi:hypothetical protein
MGRPGQLIGLKRVVEMGENPMREVGWVVDGILVWSANQKQCRQVAPLLFPFLFLEFVFKLKKKRYILGQICFSFSIWLSDHEKLPPFHDSPTHVMSL